MIDIIKPSTILTVFCNVLIFMFMQILLFWYVISRAVENVIIDKSTIIRDVVKSSTELQNRLDKYINSTDYQIIYNQSLIDGKARNDFNVDLTWKWMLIPFSVVIAIITIGVVYTFYVHHYTYYNTLKLDKTDVIILATVFLSFLTELVFIFVLIMRFVYVSDMDMVIFFINSGPAYVPFTLPPFTLPTLPPSSDP